jgi:hypothetical protein
MSLADTYRQAWQGKFGLGHGWTANWWPGTPIALGQFGVMRDRQLEHMGHVEDYGVSFAFEPTDPEPSGPWVYSSSDDTLVQIGTDATVDGWQWIGSAKAGLSISFGRTESIFLSATDTTIESVRDVNRLKKDLLTTAIEHGMPVGQSVIVELQRTKQAELVVCHGAKGEFKATTNVAIKPDVNPSVEPVVGSLAGSLDVKTQTGGTTKQDFPNGMILAYRVVTLRRTGWLWWRHISVEDSVQSADEDYFVRIP